MTLPSSGAIKFSELATEFGGSNTNIKISDYKPNHNTWPYVVDFDGFPGGGVNNIDLSSYYGRQRHAAGIEFTAAASSSPPAAAYQGGTGTKLNEYMDSSYYLASPYSGSVTGAIQSYNPSPDETFFQTSGSFWDQPNHGANVDFKIIGPTGALQTMVADVVSSQFEYDGSLSPVPPSYNGFVTEGNTYGFFVRERP